MSDGARQLDRRRARRRAAGRRSRAAIRRRIVRDHRSFARGVARFLEAHLARLALGLRAPRDSVQRSMAALRAEIATRCALAPPLRDAQDHRHARQRARRGYAPAGHRIAAAPVSLWPRAALPTALREGVALRVARSRLADNPALAGIKHLNRLENVLAARRSCSTRMPSTRCCSMLAGTWSGRHEQCVPRARRPGADAAPSIAAAWPA